MALVVGLQPSEIQLLQTCHENFRNHAYDVLPAMNVMARFISTKCRTTVVSNPPSTANSYLLKSAGRDGLLMWVKGLDVVCYLFNVRTGDVFVCGFEVEERSYDFPDSLMFMPGAPFFMVKQSLTAHRYANGVTVTSSSCMRCGRSLLV
jgi:hypothetical protein